MSSSLAFQSLKVAALLVFLVGLASQKHAVTSFGDRSTLGTFINSCFKRTFEKDIDSGGPESFKLSKKEWKLFKVFQSADTNCECTVSCNDPNSRIDVYATFERRPRLDNDWDGWACRETLAFNTQTCFINATAADSTCRVAVRGDTIDRPHSACNVTCTVDTTTTVIPPPPPLL